MVHLMQVAIPKGIALRLHLGRDLPPVEGDPARIQQVILNLVTNAAEAIGDARGFILVGTRLVELTEAPLVPGPGRDLAPGRFVVLDVSDTGCGMSPEVRGRILEPFYSTKAPGRGLGLSTLGDFLEGHGAGLRIRSAEGRGSTFEIFFPAGKGELPPPDPWESEERASFPGRVLLADGEGEVLEAVGRALEGMGLEVVRAGSGAEALRAFEAEAGAFDVVLMDAAMPDMDGLEAFRAMRRLRPGAAVILSGGIHRPWSAAELQEAGLAGFLPRPYRIPELRRALTLALDAVPGARDGL
jgi:CheY-like chemotaxis protein